MHAYNQQTEHLLKYSWSIAFVRNEKEVKPLIGKMHRVLRPLKLIKVLSVCF